MSQKLSAGGPIPEITLPTIDGGEAKIGGIKDRWQMIIVYRGLHCPICKNYTAKIEALCAQLKTAGIKPCTGA